MKLPVMAALSLLTLSACAPTDTTTAISPLVRTVEVDAAYRERIALTPGHTLNVSIQDVSLADAPAVIINQVSMLLDDRAPPYTVHIDIPEERIQQNHRYAARAEIRDSDGKLRFTTDTHHGVLTMGQPDSATIVMIGVQ